MLIKRTAIRLVALGALVMLANRAVAQPAHSNVHYQTPNPTYENASAPFAKDQPVSGHDLWPFKPVGFEPQFNWFAPTETSGYGRGPRPKIGYFFSYERVYWSLSKPETAQIGSPTATGAGVSFPTGTVPFENGDPVLEQGIPTIYTNTVDTGFMTANGAWGNRWELGYMDVDDYGWLVSVLDHVSQSQYYEDNSTIMQFDDPANLLQGFNGDFLVTFNNPFFTFDFVTYGKIPIRFDLLQTQNITRLNGVEVMRMYRARQLHSGAWFELLYGVRWLQMQDTFNVWGFNSFNSTITAPISPSQTSAVFNYFNPIADSFWKTRTQNNMVGPQIGFRMWRQRQRWITSVEARFMAAANFQNTHQQTNLGNNTLPNTVLLFPGFDDDPNDPSNFFVPYIFQGLGSRSHAFATTFSPVGEIRLNAAWQATRSVAIKVGYTGLVMGNTARASNKVDYSGPNLVSIKPGSGNEIFFVNGINFGVEVNR